METVIHARYLSRSYKNTDTSNTRKKKNKWKYFVNQKYSNTLRNGCAGNQNHCINNSFTNMQFLWDLLLLAMFNTVALGFWFFFCFFFLKKELENLQLFGSEFQLNLRESCWRQWRRIRAGEWATRPQVASVCSSFLFLFYSVCPWRSKLCSRENVLSHPSSFQGLRHFTLTEFPGSEAPWRLKY